MNQLTYPIAYHREADVLVEATKDTPKGKNYTYICRDCNEEMTFVPGKKVRAHFKHKPGSQCQGSVETFVHWVTKEILLKEKKIKLPPVLGIDLLSDKTNKKYREKIKLLLEREGLSKVTFYNELSLPKFKIDKKALAREKALVKFDNVNIEKRYKTKKGDVIVVDVVGEVGGREIFIEPFYTSPLTDYKRAKLRDVNNSCISIQLCDYLLKNGHYDYSIPELTRFIVDDTSCKKWEYINAEVEERLVDALISNLIVDLKEKLVESKKKAISLSALKEKEEKENKLIKQIDVLSNQSDNLKQEIKELKNIKRALLKELNYVLPDDKFSFFN